MIHATLLKGRTLELMARKKNVTFNDIAQYTHFSKTTISRYFNNPDSLTPENQQIITDRTFYSLDEQLRACILLLQKQWEEKKLTLAVELEKTEYCGNLELMSHAWRNLLENAVKFSPEGGSISVKCYRKEDTIHVIIENDCQVLSQDTLNHIFDKFYQGDTSHAAKGNGLGLPLVKRIIQLCGGYITVISDSKHGISFDIELPCADSENGDQK